MQKYAIGQPFPGPIPPQDGLSFEIGPDGDMVLLIQFQTPTPQEAAALQAGFFRYAYYETPDSNLVCWVFKYPAPVLYMDAPFHAGLYKDDRAHKLLQSAGNALSVFVLDGAIIKNMRFVGLHPETMTIFRARIQHQLSIPITRAQYEGAVNLLYQNTSEEIYLKGSTFLIREVEK